MSEFKEINDYMQWNKALWVYFFSKGTENPIIYIDKSIIGTIGNNAIIAADDYEQDFLSKTLLNSEKIINFANDWRCWAGSGIPVNQGVPYRRDLGRWTFEDLALFLAQKKVQIYGKYERRIEIPAYLGILCAIMYLACNVDPNHSPNHNDIKKNAKKYLGKEYRGKVGELIDDLFKKLHQDVVTFDSDRMVCGQQRHMSRIKFHTLLKPSERKDFIDFIEINNLKWEYEQYHEFINNIFIPALNRADKRQYIDLVTKKEYIPYVKSILQSDLNFGKEETETGNTRQIIDVVWKYELYFNFDGSSSFYISTDRTLPFGLSVGDGAFKIDDKNKNNDYIAEETDFVKYAPFEFRWDNDEYNLINVTSNWNELFFRKVSGDGIYYQVSELQEGGEYIRFIRKGDKNNKIEEGWELSQKNISVKDYDIYETYNYRLVKLVKRNRANNNKIDDAFYLYGVGSWFSIYLQEGQKLYWQEDKLSNNGNPQPKEVQYIVGDDKKCYFRLFRTSESQISGKLIVSNGDIESRLTNESVVCIFEWKGDSVRYYMNGWGEVSKNDTMPIMDGTVIRKENIEIPKQKTPKTDMLIQILYDIADGDGCVSQTKLVSAINFVLGAFDIIPTRQNRRSVIYALKRLGYMMSFYNHKTSSYENQLIPSFLERSNYTLSRSRNNAYLVKGVYDRDKLEGLLGKCKDVGYKRPYASDETIQKNPEYQILPDLILVETEDFNKWKKIDYPISDSLVDMMSNISTFEEYFKVEDNGDVYYTTEQLNTPCMIKDKYGAEVLCTQNDQKQYITHKTYCDDEYNYNLIPKHLSRAYCQYKKNMPVCIMRCDPDNNIDFCTITFLSGMGKPQILDMALCDLNLGLPLIEYLFIVDQQHHKYSVIEGRSFTTHATNDNNKSLKNILEKLSGRVIDNYDDSSAILVSRNWRHINYKMQLRVDNDYRTALVLKCGDNIEAFSWGNKVYAKPQLSQMFKEVISGNSINEKLSDIINNKKLDYGGEMRKFDMTVFDEKNLKPVRIVVKR